MMIALLEKHIKMELNNFMSLCPSAVELKSNDDAIQTKSIGAGSYGKIYSTVNGVIKVQRELIVDFNNAIDYEGILESSILQTVSHSNIISVDKAEIVNDHIHIFMERGENIDFDNIDKSEYSIANFIKQISSALVYLHTHGISHRDIKPGNIVKVDNVWKLIDFGAIRISVDDVRDINRPNDYTTLWYRSPEKFVMEYNNFKYEPGDVWSLGICVLQIFFEIENLKCKTDIKQIKAIEKLNVKSQYPDMNTDLADLLTIMLHIDPKKRVTAREIASHAFISKFFKDSMLSLQIEYKVGYKFREYRWRNSILKCMHDAAIILKLRTITLLSSFMLIDIILSRERVENIALLTCVSLALESACYETDKIYAKEWIKISGNTFTTEEFGRTFKEIFTEFNCNVIFPSTFNMKFYLNERSKGESDLFRDIMYLVYASNMYAANNITKLFAEVSDIVDSFSKLKTRHRITQKKFDNLYCYENLFPPHPLPIIPDPLEKYRYPRYGDILCKIEKTFYSF